jgi:hypothetical protein
VRGAPKRLVSTAWSLGRTWLRWFWRLTAGGKVAATAAEIVVLYLVSQTLPVSPASRQEITSTGSVLLALLLVVGLALGSTRAG